MYRLGSTKKCFTAMQLVMTIIFDSLIIKLKKIKISQQNYQLTLGNVKKILNLIHEINCLAQNINRVILIIRVISLMCDLTTSHD